MSKDDHIIVQIELLIKNSARFVSEAFVDHNGNYLVMLPIKNTFNQNGIINITVYFTKDVHIIHYESMSAVVPEVFCSHFEFHNDPKSCSTINHIYQQSFPVDGKVYCKVSVYLTS